MSAKLDSSVTLGDGNLEAPVHDFDGVLETAIDHLRRVGSAQFDDTLVLAYVDRSDDDGPAVGLTLDGAQDTEPFHVWLDETHTGVLVLIRVIMPPTTFPAPGSADLTVAREVSGASPTPADLAARDVEHGGTFRDAMDSLSDPTGRQTTARRSTTMSATETLTKLQQILAEQRPAPLWAADPDPWQADGDDGYRFLSRPVATIRNTCRTTSVRWSMFADVQVQAYETISGEEDIPVGVFLEVGRGNGEPMFTPSNARAIAAALLEAADIVDRANGSSAQPVAETATPGPTQRRVVANLVALLESSELVLDVDHVATLAAVFDVSPEALLRGV